MTKNLLLFCLLAVASLSAQISSKFVSLDQNSVGTHNNVPENSLRMWNTATAWEDIQPTDGTHYSWSRFDQMLDNAKTLGVTDILMTLSNTPKWAAPGPVTGCTQGNVINGLVYACAPPSDVDTTDQRWKNYVKAVVDRAEAQTNGRPRILYWEMWNEPAWNPQHYTGTYAQMVRMVNDACAYIHAPASGHTDLKCLTPGNEALTNYHMLWWNGFNGAGGLANVDYLAYHGYTQLYPLNCGTYAIPESVATHVSNLAALSSKPQWDTEGSWGPTDKTCLDDLDLQAAWVGRSFLMHAGLGTKRYYWYAVQGLTGGLVDANFNLLKSGTAFIQMASWFAGATSTAPCSVVGTVWTCNFNVSGLLTRAVWDTSQTCSGGVCSTVLYPVLQSDNWIHFRDLDGNTWPMPPCCVGVSIGIKPILLENF